MEIGRYLIAFVGVFNFGGLVADAIVPATARQHLFHPHWPPFAKFHNAQTMMMGLVSGTLSLAILFGTPSLTLPMFLLAAAIAANYFVTMALAPLFPKTAWIDPEFASGTPRPPGFAPQQLISYVICGLVIIAIVSAVSA
jgi:hypothetical protein